jgi:septum formation protein
MLVLASQSPRRKELLHRAGIECAVQPAEVEETLLPGESPRAFAERLARDKARAVARLRPGDFVLGADTVVVVAGEVLGKPADAADAARMLRSLSGRSHEVITGVCLIGPQVTGDRQPAAGFEDVRSEATTVHFQPLTEQDIAFYVAHGEPMDKAGAYAIQGIASRWIPRIDGCYFNVVGLPVPLVWRMLREHGAI